MTKLDHIAIVVEDVYESVPKYEELLQLKSDTPVSVPDQGVISAVFPLEGCSIELMQPTDPNGGIRKYLDKKGPGIHHIAIKVEDIDEAEAAYQAMGYRLIVGSANGKKSVFIHPKSTGGILVELCANQEK